MRKGGGGYTAITRPLRPGDAHATPTCSAGEHRTGRSLRRTHGLALCTTSPWDQGCARSRCAGGRGWGGDPAHLSPPHYPPPPVTLRRVVVPLRGPGQSPVLPFACCVGSLRSVGRCGRCSCWCRFRLRGAQWLVCRGCAECGGMCRLRVSGAQ